MKKRELSKDEMYDLIDFLGNRKETYGVMALVSTLLSNQDFSGDRKNCRDVIKTMILNKENDFEIISCIIAIVIISDRENAREWLDIFKLPVWNKDFFYSQYVLGYILAIMSLTNWFLGREEVLAEKDPLIIRLNSGLLEIVPRLSLVDSLVFKEMQQVFLFTRDNSRAPFEGHLTSIKEIRQKQSRNIF